MGGGGRTRQVQFNIFEITRQQLSKGLNLRIFKKKQIPIPQEIQKSTLTFFRF